MLNGIKITRTPIEAKAEEKQRVKHNICPYCQKPSLGICSTRYASFFDSVFKGKIGQKVYSYTCSCGAKWEYTQEMQ